MHIFISWSGREQQNLAEKMKEVVEDLFWFSHVFVSSRSISSGKPWYDDIYHNAKSNTISILLIDGVSSRSDWVLFEAGILTSNSERTFFYLLDGLDAIPPKSPLRNLQGESISCSSILKLFHAISAYEPKGENLRTIPYDKFSISADTIENNYKSYIKNPPNATIYNSINDYFNEFGVDSNNENTNYIDTVFRQTMKRFDFHSGIVQKNIIIDISISISRGRLIFEEKSTSNVFNVSNDDKCFRPSFTFSGQEEFLKHFDEDSLIEIFADEKLVADVNRNKNPELFRSVEQFGSYNGKDAKVFRYENGTCLEMEVPIARFKNVNISKREVSLLSSPSVSHARYYNWPTFGIKLNAFISKAARKHIRFISFNGPIKRFEQGGYGDFHHVTRDEHSIYLNAQDACLHPGESFVIGWEYK